MNNRSTKIQICHFLEKTPKIRSLRYFYPINLKDLAILVLLAVLQFLEISIG